MINLRKTKASEPTVTKKIAKKTGGMLGLGMQKIFIDKSTSIRQAGKDIYFKSHQEQFQHDWQIDDLENGGFRRMEDMDDTYLKNKNNKNIQWKNAIPIKELWESKKSDYMKYNLAPKHLREKNFDGIKPIMNFRLSWDNKHELKTSKEKLAHFQSVSNFLKNKFGKKNIVYITQKNDEDGTHYSFSVLNYDDKSHKTIALHMQKFGENSFSGLQGEIADHLKNDKVDYGYTRGEFMSGNKHVRLGEALKKVEKAQKELEDIQEDYVIIEEMITMGQVFSWFQTISDQIDKAHSTKFNQVQDRFGKHYEAGDKKKALKQVKAMTRILKSQKKKKSITQN